MQSEPRVWVFLEALRCPYACALGGPKGQPVTTVTLVTASIPSPVERADCLYGSPIDIRPSGRALSPTTPRWPVDPPILNPAQHPRRSVESRCSERRPKMLCKGDTGFDCNICAM